MYNIKFIVICILLVVFEGKGIINFLFLMIIILVFIYIDYFFFGVLWKFIVLVKSIDFINFVEVFFYIIIIVLIFVWNIFKNRYIF